MTAIDIPADRAIRHGGENFLSGGAKFAETFELWGDLKASDRVLDIGCGPGRMAIGIGERFGWANQLTGFDVIKVDVDVCQNAITSAHPNFRFHHVNAWNGLYNSKGTVKPHEVVFPAENESIDFAFATSVFTHMFRLEIERYLSEIHRTLDDGGRLMSTWFAITDEAFASTRAGKARFSFSHERDDGSFIEKPEHPEDVVGYRHRDIVALLERAGFSDITFHQGAWSRSAPAGYKARHSQDVFVCKK